MMDSKRSQKNHSLFVGRSLLFRIFLIHTLSLLAFFVITPKLVSQEIDSIYTRNFNKGKSLYNEANYNDALQHFKIAEFGFFKQKSLHIETLLYLSLCHFNRKDLEESKVSLKAALDLSENDGFEKMNLAPELLKEIDNLMLLFKFKIKKPKPLSSFAQSPLTRRRDKEKNLSLLDKKQNPKGDNSKSSGNEIKNDLQIKQYYYNLYSSQLNQNEIKTARKTLEKLLHSYPNDAQAHFLLGKLWYGIGNFRKSKKHFKRIITISKKESVVPKVLNTSKAGLILCSFFQNDQKNAILLASQWMDILNNSFETLDLGENEKNRIRSIFTQVENQQKEKRDEIYISNAKNVIKKYPKGIDLYFDLYNTYLRLNRIDDAKKIIKTLIKNNPTEINGLLILVQMEYKQKKYKKAHKFCKIILDYASKTKIDREIAGSSLIYSILCNIHFKKIPNAKAFYTTLNKVISDTEISNIIKRENLEEEWKSALYLINQ